MVQLASNMKEKILATFSKALDRAKIDTLNELGISIARFEKMLREDSELQSSLSSLISNKFVVANDNAEADTTPKKSRRKRK